MEKEEIKDFVDELTVNDDLPGPVKRPGVLQRLLRRSDDNQQPAEPTPRERLITIQESQGAILDRLSHLTDQLKSYRDACSVPPPPPPVRTFDIAFPASGPAKLVAFTKDDADYLTRLVTADIDCVKDELSPSELVWRSEIHKALSSMFGGDAH